MRSVWRWLRGVRLRLQLRKSRHSDHRPRIGVFAGEPAELIPLLVLSVEPFGFGFCGSPIHTASVRRLLTSGPERGSVVHRTPRVGGSRVCKLVGGARGDLRTSSEEWLV